MIILQLFQDLFKIKTQINYFIKYNLFILFNFIVCTRNIMNAIHHHTSLQINVSSGNAPIFSILFIKFILNIYNKYKVAMRCQSIKASSEQPHTWYL